MVAARFLHLQKTQNQRVGFPVSSCHCFETPTPGHWDIRCEALRIDDTIKPHPTEKYMWVWVRPHNENDLVSTEDSKRIPMACPCCGQLYEEMDIMRIE